MQLYLRHIPTNTYKDLATYPTNDLENPPYPAPLNFEWVEGSPDGLDVYSFPSLVERLGSIFEAAATPEVPVEVKVYFRQMQVVVSFCLTTTVPDIDSAQYIISHAVMPGDTWTEEYTLPEPFETVKQALLTELSRTD